MNEPNTTTHELDHLHDLGSIDLEQLLTSCLPRKALLPLVKERVKLVIAQFAQRAFVANATNDAMASARLVDYLRSAAAIPLPMELCTLMARVGFDKALFTYGHSDGMPVGYAEGSWLLKFVGHAEKEPSSPQEASWLRLLDNNATRH